MLKTILLLSLLAGGGWALLSNWHPDRSAGLPQTPDIRPVSAGKHSPKRRVPRPSLPAESREVAGKSAPPIRVPPRVRASRAEILRACEAYGYEYTTRPNPQYEADRTLLLQEVERLLAKNRSRFPGKESDEEWISTLCLVEWQRNLAEAQAVAHRLYGSYAPGASYYPR